MIEFIFLFLYRTLSGIQNGIGYALPNPIKGPGESTNPPLNRWLGILSVSLAIVAYLPVFLSASQVPDVLKVLAVLGSTISLFGVLGVWDNFTSVFNRFVNDIHFWELLATGGVTLCWVALGGNIYLIAAHVYPALLLHKGAVNMGSGLPFWDTRTNDATGKTFSVPLLNINIPRLGLRGRQIIAAVSIIGAAVVYWQGYSFTLLDLL